MMLLFFRKSLSFLINNFYLKPNFLLKRLVTSFAIAISFTVFITVTTVAYAQNVPVMRISSENSENHIQTQAIQLFADRLNEKLDGRFKVDFQHSAKLFRDRNVVKAIADGKTEMAVPGTWQLDRYEPNVGIFLLPMFYGQSAEINYNLRDGEVGEQINKMLSNKLGVHIVGRWIDLGYAHVYGTTMPIKSHNDLA